MLVQQGVLLLYATCLLKLVSWPFFILFILSSALLPKIRNWATYEPEDLGLWRNSRGWYLRVDSESLDLFVPGEVGFQCLSFRHHFVHQGADVYEQIWPDREFLRVRLPFLHLSRTNSGLTHWMEDAPEVKDPSWIMTSAFPLSPRASLGSSALAA